MVATQAEIDTECAKLRRIYSPPIRPLDLSFAIEWESKDPQTKIGTFLSDIYVKDWYPYPSQPAVKVAVKFSRAFHFASTAEETLKILKRLHQEISVWNCIEHHENIQPLIGLLWRKQESAYPAVVSIWEKSGNLIQYLGKLPPMTEDQLYNIKYSMLEGVLKGLMHLHKNEITHADLKGENVLVALDENNVPIPRLCDFGLAYTSLKLSVKFSLRMSAKGTPGFMAPEVEAEYLNPDPDADHKVFYTPRVDVWAFGCLVRQIFGLKPTAVQAGVSASSALEQRHLDFVSFCCVKDPAARHAQADEALLHEFHKLREWQPSSTSASSSA